MPRSINAVMTATYFLVGRAIVEHEQGGATRAAYGGRLLKRLGADLSSRFGRGFSADNLETMRRFYVAYASEISETLPRKSSTDKSETLSRKSTLDGLSDRFALPWSHYFLLVRRSRSPQARAFYETEALRGGWTVRQLQRQIDTQFYERTALSRNKTAMLAKGAKTKPEDLVTPEEELKDPLVLEFLGLKDEYSESDLEQALISAPHSSWRASSPYRHTRICRTLPRRANSPRVGQCHSVPFGRSAVFRRADREARAIGRIAHILRAKGRVGIAAIATGWSRDIQYD
jgi:hypothetical protein